MNKKAVNIGFHLIGWLVFLVLPAVRGKKLFIGEVNIPIGKTYDVIFLIIMGSDIC